MNALIMTLACALQAAPASGQDIIKLKSGVEVKAKIIRLTSQGLSYVDAAGKTVNLKADEFGDIVFFDTPANLPKANQAAGESKWDKADILYQEALNEIAGGKARKDIHLQYILYSWAVSYTQRGKPDEALGMLTRLRKECSPDSRLRAESYDRSLEIAKKKDDKAVQDVLAEMKGEPDPVGGKAELELAKMRYARNAFDEAYKMFDGLAGKPGAPYAADARLWALRCLRGLKKWDELDAACARILGDRANTSPALAQSAGASLADGLLKKAAADKTKIREALLAAAQAIAVGPPAAREEAEDYALAVLTAAKAYALMEKETDKPDAKAEYKDRAKNYCLEIAQSYKGSSLGDMATKAMVELGLIEKPKEAEKPKDPKDAVQPQPKGGDKPKDRLP